MRALTALLALAVLGLASPGPWTLRQFRYRRTVSVPPGAQHVCAILPGELYAHAASQLTDLRVMDLGSGADIPYALTMSQVAPGEDVAPVQNVDSRGDHLTFDLTMPPRPYSTVQLTVGAGTEEKDDFVAGVKVAGLRTLTDRPGIALGSFSIYSLTGQGLGRSTALPLAETTYPYLHIDLQRSQGVPRKLSSAPRAPLEVEPAKIPASREAQTRFTTLAETSDIIQAGAASQATFAVPARVPVEHVSFTLIPGSKSNFSQKVNVTGQFAGQEALHAGEAQESVEGTISRVRLKSGQAGGDIGAINEQELGIDAVLGLNTRRDMLVLVSWDHAAVSVPIESVRLQMRERKICFDPPSEPIEIAYGAPGVPAPRYDYTPVPGAVLAQLSPEQSNLDYTPESPRHIRRPKAVWLSLLFLAAFPILLAAYFLVFREVRSPKKENG